MEEHDMPARSEAPLEEGMHPACPATYLWCVCFTSQEAVDFLDYTTLNLTPSYSVSCLPSYTQQRPLHRCHQSILPNLLRISSEQIPGHQAREQERVWQS